MKNPREIISVLLIILATVFSCVPPDGKGSIEDESSIEGEGDSIKTPNFVFIEPQVDTVD